MKYYGYAFVQCKTQYGTTWNLYLFFGLMVITKEANLQNFYLFLCTNNYKQCKTEGISGKFNVARICTTGNQTQK